MKIEKKLDVLDWMKIHYLDRECLNKTEEKELDNFVNELKKAINYSHCCETLKDEEETAFDLWLKNFKHAERDLYWYNEDTLYCIEAMKDIYNTEGKPTL